MIKIQHPIFCLHLAQSAFAAALTSVAITGYTVTEFNNGDSTAVYVQGNRALTSGEMTALQTALDTNAGVTGITVSTYP